MEKPDQAVLIEPGSDKKLARTVIVLGLVSFFNDFALDIVIPLIPILLTSFSGPSATGRGVVSVLLLVPGVEEEKAPAHGSTAHIPDAGCGGECLGVMDSKYFVGLCAGMSEGAERAIISDYTLPRERGTAFGWYHLMVGMAAIPAGLLFGSIWQFQTAAMAFFFGGGLAAIAAVLLRVWAWPVRKVSTIDG